MANQNSQKFGFSLCLCENKFGLLKSLCFVIVNYICVNLMCT